MDGYRQSSSEPEARPANWKILLWSLAYMIPLLWMWNLTDYPDSFGVEFGRGKAGALESWYYSYLLLQRHHVLDVVTFIYMWAIVAAFLGFVASKLIRRTNFSFYSANERAGGFCPKTIDPLAYRPSLPRFTLSESVLMAALVIVLLLGLAWGLGFDPKSLKATFNSEQSVRTRCFNEKGSYPQSDVTSACRQLLVDSTVAIRAQPGDANAYFNRGFAYEHAGDLNHAIVDFSQVIRLSPGSSEAYYYRWAAYKDSGDEQRADADFAELSRLDPSFAAQLRGNR